MTAGEGLHSLWTWDPAAAAACSLLLAAHLALTGLRPGWRGLWFLTGLALLLLGLVSPVAVLGHALFSAHMVQHLLFVLVVPPLLLLGLPPRLAEWASRWSCARRSDGWPWPLLAWACGAGAMWLWHVPALYDAASVSHALRAFEHGLALAMGTMFWWPIVAPAPELRLEPLLAVLYLFTACLACTVLGIVLTFAPPGLYAAPAGGGAALQLVRSRWGLSPEADQQLGGLLMWVPACIVYSSAVIGVLARWYGADDDDGWARASETPRAPSHRNLAREESR
jgi:putative membrane protein